jgi:hypothetical protein
MITVSPSTALSSSLAKMKSARNKAQRKPQIIEQKTTRRYLWKSWSLGATNSADTVKGKKNNSQFGGNVETCRKMTMPIKNAIVPAHIFLGSP